MGSSCCSARALFIPCTAPCCSPQDKGPWLLQFCLPPSLPPSLSQRQEEGHLGGFPAVEDRCWMTMIAAGVCASLPRLCLACLTVCQGSTQCLLEQVATYIERHPAHLLTPPAGSPSREGPHVCPVSAPVLNSSHIVQGCRCTTQWCREGGAGPSHPPKKPSTSLGHPTPGCNPRATDRKTCPASAG